MIDIIDIDIMDYDLDLDELLEEVGEEL